MTSPLMHEMFAAAANRRTHVGARTKQTFQLVGQYSAGDTADTPAGQVSDGGNVTRTTTPAGGGLDPAGGVVNSLLGDLGGILGTSDGSSSTTTTGPGVTVTTSQTAPTHATDIGPTTVVTLPVGPAPAPKTPTTTPTAAPKSHLLWWIAGGLAAAAFIYIGWRLLGHKGAKAAALSSAKTAAYYIYRIG